MSSVINAIYRNITLDLYTVGSAVTVTAMQADTLSRYIRVTLTNNGSDYEIDEDAHPQIFIVKSDGRIVYNNGTVDDGALLFELDNQMLAAPGKCKTQILLWDRDYEQVLRNATPLFIDVIEKVDEESAVASTSEYGVLEDILQAIEQGGYITDNNFTNAYKDKLDGIETGAEANQNAFSQVVADGTTVYSDEATSTIEIEGSDGITVSGDNTNKRITVGVDGDTLVDTLPTASATQAGILTAEDYVRFGNGSGGGGVSISQVTETDITLTTPSAVDYNVPRSESILAQIFDNVYPIGAAFKTSQQGNYPSIGAWTLADRDLIRSESVYSGTTSGGNVKVYCTCEDHHVHINFEIALPSEISGLYTSGDGEPVTIYSFSAEDAGVSSLVSMGKRYGSGFIHHNLTTLTAPTPALFSISAGSTAKIDLVSWVGDIPVHSETGSRIAYFSYDAILPTSYLTGASRYVYRRTA